MPKLGRTNIKSILTGNRKVRNATACEYNGIKFRSRLEKFCYEKLLQVIDNPGYESFKEVLMKGFESDVSIYQPDKDGNLRIYDVKIRDITYTPDFSFIYKDCEIYIDTKGKANDAYPIKKKLFLKLRNEKEKSTYFFEPHNQRQVLQCIEVLKSL